MRRSDLKGKIGRRARTGAATIAGATLALAATAGGAWGASFTIGAEGPAAPALAIGADGTAYVAYDESTQTAGTTGIAVCTLPSKATRCAYRAVLPQPASAPGNPQSPDVGWEQPVSIFVNTAGEPVVLVQGQSQSSSQVGPPAPELIYASTDRGASFTTNSSYADTSPATGWAITGAVGNLAFTSSAFAPWIGDGVAFGAAEVANGITATRLDVNAAAVGAPGSGYAQLRILPTALTSTLSSAVSHSASGVSIVHAWSGASAKKGDLGQNSTGYAYYSGPRLKGASAAQAVADADDASNYKVGVIDDHVSWDSLAAGSRGQFLFENPLPTRARRNEVTVREWRGSSFGSAREIDCGRGAGYEADGDVDASEDPVTGDLQAVVDEYTKHVWSVLYVELTRSGQSSPTVLTTFKGAIVPGPSGTAVASTGSHPGLVVWRHGGVKGDPVVGSWLPTVSTRGCQATKK